MRTLFKVQEVLLKKGTYFCIQSGGIHDFLDVCIEDKKNKRKHYRHGTLEEIEAELLEDFGHLIGEKKKRDVDYVKKVALPPLPVMPPLPPLPGMN